MEQLNTWPDISQGRKKIYDYDKFLDGTIWECKRGVDFVCKRQSFMTTMRKEALARGLKFRYVMVPNDADTLVIQAYMPGDPS